MSEMSQTDIDRRDAEMNYDGAVVQIPAVNYAELTAALKIAVLNLCDSQGRKVSFPLDNCENAVMGSLVGLFGRPLKIAEGRFVSLDFQPKGRIEC